MNGAFSRRDLLAAAGAATAAAALPAAVQSVGSAAAQTPGASQAPALAYRSATQLAAALASRDISAVELADLSIKRIDQRDDKLNAVVVRDFERARAAAAAADAALARGERKPLLGVPMTVKESFNVAGLATTWGIPAAKDWVPPEDAVTVARLKAAGAIILGKTNVPLMLSDYQSYNAVYGTTNNPWDVSRSPGGSSGGAAAALAAGFVPLELGSDIGGSLRVPAHYCGVFAHKPTQALVPLRGHIPPRVPAQPRDVDLVVVGPMARTAADLALALDIMAGPDTPQATAYRLDLPASRHTELRSFRVMVLDIHPLLRTSNAVRGALDRLADRLGKAGATVARSSPLLPDLARIARVNMQLLTGGLGADLPIDVYRRIEQAAAGFPADDTSLESLRVRGSVQSHREWVRADRTRDGIARQWREFFAEWDVVVCPVMPTPAFAHDHSEPQRQRRIDIDGTSYSYFDQIVWCAVATLTGQPATAVPIGQSETGLPIGAQIIGPHLEDRTTLAFAALIEREFGGFVAPPGFAG